MFVDLSWSHILLVLVIALVVVGPKDLPKLMHTMGQWVARARAMADQFRRSFDEMARQSELDELRKEIDELRNVRPLADMQQSILPTDLMTLPPIADAVAAAETMAAEEPNAPPAPEDAAAAAQKPPAP